MSTSLPEDAPRTNREKAKAPRGGGFYCLGCDRYGVWAGQKCPVCGVRTGKRRWKPTRRPT